MSYKSNASDGSRELKRRFCRPNRSRSVFGAAVDRRAAIEKKLGHAVVTSKDRVIQRGPEIIKILVENQNFTYITCIIFTWRNIIQNCYFVGVRNFEYDFF